MSRAWERSCGTARLALLRGDGGSFDREFWARISPSERLRHGETSMAVYRDVRDRLAALSAAGG